MGPWRRPHHLSLILWMISMVCFCWSENSQPQKGSALTVVEQTESSDDGEVEDDLDSEDLEVFYPTNEWQMVNPGQAIPVGLHVRLNLQTGINEAKLPDSESGKGGMKYWKQGNRQGMINTDSKSFTAEELKKALKFMKQGTPVENLEEEGRQEELRKRFRPIKELKKDFEEMNLVMETDMEIITKLVNKFNASRATTEEKIAALTDLEYYVHQLDNGQYLMTTGGLQLVVNALNTTEPLVQEYAAFVLGSALSSNPRVQVEAMEGGALQKLLVLMATDQTMRVKKKALFALSSMLRHFPFAQQHFLRLGGLQVLRQLFQVKEMEPLCVRAVTLLYDMLMEKELVEHAQDSNSQHKEKQRQYDHIDLLPAMLEQDWCILVPTLLTSPEHDTREKVLKTMSFMMSSCRNHYQALQGLNSSLSELQEEYQRLAAVERSEADEDGYFVGLLNSIDSIIQELG
eukprot:gi/632948390/ref/XP_007889572.1/ PREDICTED: nucleotide exchange factor SIL1 isoform X2 [Callorhinchus milii]